MPPRAELIGLLSGLLQAQVAPVLATTARAVPDLLAANGLSDARLVLDPNALTCFPHVVEKDGVPVRLREEKFMRTLSAVEREAEEAQWAAAIRDEDGQWQACATKMTRFGLRLVDGKGEPVDGSTLQQGGLELELSLQSVSGELLTDAHNPRPNEGCLAGSGKGAFETRVRLFESRHLYRFHVMLLSSHIGGALLRIHVAPTRADLAARPNLCFTSRPFLSRARDPGPASARAAGKRKAAEEDTAVPAPGDKAELLNTWLAQQQSSTEAVGEYLGSPEYQDLSAFGDGEPLYRSAVGGAGFGDDDDDDDDDDEAEAEAEALPAASARVQNVEARARLQGMLDALESRQPLPSGPALVEALRMCRIGA